MGCLAVLLLASIGCSSSGDASDANGFAYNGVTQEDSSFSYAKLNRTLYMGDIEMSQFRLWVGADFSRADQEELGQAQFDVLVGNDWALWSSDTAFQLVAASGEPKGSKWREHLVRWVERIGRVKGVCLVLVKPDWGSDCDVVPVIAAAILKRNQ